MIVDKAAGAPKRFDGPGAKWNPFLAQIEAEIARLAHVPEKTY